MIEVRDGRLGKAVHAARANEPGELILRGWGPDVPLRTRHSLQVDHDRHVVIRGPIELINHSCDPSCGVLIRLDDEVMEIRARRPIAQGEELSTDYATFESRIEHMTEPCQCGSPLCRGQITGYWDLPGERRAAYGPYVAAYLRESEAVMA
jgi:hypothetical protein